MSAPMKFIEVTHVAKPDRQTDKPQTAVAHDNFWDYVYSNQESTHMVI